MAISLVGFGTLVVANNNTVTVTFPAGIQEYDRIELIGGIASSATEQAASGFTQFLAAGAGPTGGDYTGRRARLFVKRATAADAASPSINITITGGSAGVYNRGYAIAWRGDRKDNTLAVAVATTSNATTDNTIEYPACALGTAGIANGCIVVHGILVAVAQSAHTTISGFVNAMLQNAPSGTPGTFGLQYQVQTTATNLASGAITGTGTAGQSIGISYALAPSNSTTPTLASISVIDATVNTFTIQFTPALGNDPWIHVQAVAVRANATAPVAANILANEDGDGHPIQGAGSVVPASTAQTSVVVTVTGNLDPADLESLRVGLIPPKCDLYLFGYNSAGNGTVYAITGQSLDPAAGKTWTTVNDMTPPVDNAHWLGEDLAYALGDIVIADTVDSQGDAVTINGDTTFEIAAGGDFTKRWFQYDIYDDSTGMLFGPNLAFQNNHPPYWSGVGTLNLIEEQLMTPVALSSSINDDDDGESFTFEVLGTGDPLPSGTAMDAAGNITGTPANGSEGTYNVNVRAYDTAHDSADTTVVINVVNMELLPDVVGELGGDAVDILIAAGFVAGAPDGEIQIGYDPTKDDGVVLSQSPPGNTLQIPGTVVDLVVNSLSVADALAGFGSGLIVLKRKSVRRRKKLAVRRVKVKS